MEQLSGFLDPAGLYISSGIKVIGDAVKGMAGILDKSAVMIDKAPPLLVIDPMVLFQSLLLVLISDQRVFDKAAEIGRRQDQADPQEHYKKRDKNSLFRIHIFSLLP